MKSYSKEIKVGLFAACGLALLAALILQFSKVTSLFSPSYDLDLVTTDVGGIKEKAPVLMAGVPIGFVGSVQMNSSNKRVVIRIRVQSRYQIFEDSIFGIDQSGFLGDQFVSITPGTNSTRYLAPNQMVECRAPFNMQKTVEKAERLFDSFEKTINQLNQGLLSESNMNNLTAAIANFRLVSENATNMFGDMGGLIASNRHYVTLTVSNIQVTSERLAKITDTTSKIMDEVAVGRELIPSTMTNLSVFSQQTTQLMTLVQSGQGLAGTLLTDKETAQRFSLMVSNISLVSSNLNKMGLWHVLFHKQKEAPSSSKSNKSKK